MKKYTLSSIFKLNYLKFNVMKILIITILIISAISLNAGIIEKTYHFGNYKISDMDGFHTIEFDNAQQQAKTGEPVLPYISVQLILPPGEVAGQANSVINMLEDLNEIRIHIR